MDKNECYEVSKNFENAILNFTNNISDIMKNVNMNTLVDAFKSLLKDIPDDVKDTNFFNSIQRLDNLNLRYEDINWLFEDFGLEGFDDTLSGFLENADKNIDVHCYLKTIVLDDNISKREKVIILLAHMEPLIYNTLNYSKKPKNRLKQTVKRISIDTNHGISSKSIGKLYVLGIMYVLFANTDSYTENIDKRMPFRNNILHNGIVLYKDKDIEMVYSSLIIFLAVLVQVKKIIIADD